MINHLSILNNLVIQKPQEVDQENEAPVQWEGKKVYVENNARSGWIARIASVVLIALGITLIAAVGTSGAITFGIVVIGLTSLFLFLKEIIRHNSLLLEEKNRREGENSFSKFFGCRKDYSNIPEVEWEQDKKTVTIHLTQKKIDARPHIKQGFIPECADQKNHPFIVTLFPIDENKIDPFVFIYDHKIKKKDFKINLDGQSILLKECPMLPIELRGKRIEHIL